MSPLEPALPELFDPLGEALRCLRLSGTFYSCAELTPPWGIELPAFPGCMMFHVVTEGRSWLEVPGSAPRWLEAGSLALVTCGTGHSVRSAPDAHSTPLFDVPATKLSERCELLKHGGDGLASERERALALNGRCRATCGVVRFEHAAAAQLIAVLPPILEVHPSDDEEGEWLTSTIRFVAREARALRPGAESVITRLADILVIQAIRAWLSAAGGERRGILAGLSDPQLGAALALMHRKPEHHWTLTTLAKEVGMSRSVFVERFSQLVGKPPKSYLTELRLRLAFEELRTTSAPIMSLASRFGYQSEAAFTRAFRRAFAASPTSVRKAARPESGPGGPRGAPANES